MRWPLFGFMSSTPLLEVRHLVKTFGPGVRALQGVSFSMQTGETIAVVGGSGCGKSTLARLITGLTPADLGDVLWEGRDFLKKPRPERARCMQMVFQDPYASLNPKLTVGSQLGMTAGSLLESVGLPLDALLHYPHQFSGGQRQRIAIARALALRPKLLLADEPLSALDGNTQQQILTLLADVKKTYHLSYIFITHDLEVARDFSDRLLVLKEGCIVEEGPTRFVLAQPAHVYTQALLEAIR